MSNTESEIDERVLEIFAQADQVAEKVIFFHERKGGPMPEGADAAAFELTVNRLQGQPAV